MRIQKILSEVIREGSSKSKRQRVKERIKHKFTVPRLVYPLSVVVFFSWSQFIDETNWKIIVPLAIVAK